MTDYAEEQQNELEALQSIYPEEFEELGDNEFRIFVAPDDQDEEDPLTLALRVKYTHTYPDALPEYDIEVTQGTLSSAYQTRIMESLRAAAEESLGMVMIFTMASLVKEEVNLIMEDAERSRQEAEEEKIRIQEEKENAKFRGTKLTPERFAEWKAKFDRELAELESEEKKARARELKNRPTGRQLFEQDKSLALSDAKYMDEGDVSVDASQYERTQHQEDEEQDDSNAVWRQFGNDD